MTSSPDTRQKGDRSASRRCPRCGGCASWATATSPAPAGGVLAGAAVGAARCAARAVVQVARRGRARGQLVARRFAAIALGVSAAATWFLQTVSTRVQRRFRDKVTIALESHVATLLASIATIAHQERPEYLDRLAVLRNQVFMLDHMYMSLFTTCGWILRLAVTIALLVSIHPALALLALFALPTVLTSTWRPAVERSAYERGAQANRLARHLFDTATTAPRGRKCVSPVSAIASSRSGGWRGNSQPPDRGRTMGFGRMAHGGMGGLRCRLCRCDCLRLIGLGAPAGDVLLALAAGSRLSFYVGATVGEIGFLRGVWMDAAIRLAWLEDYASSLVATADQPAPARLAAGHSFRTRVVRVPGHRSSRARRCQCGVCRRDRLWRSLARTVREVHAGQAAGQDVRADERADPHRSDRSCAHRRRPTGAPGSRAPFRTSSASSFVARHTVGVGDVPRLDDEPAVVTAVSRAGADDVIVRLTGGLETQLGRRGRTAWTSASVSGRSWRSRAASCVTSRSCWCSTSRRPHSMRKPSTRCSSVMRPPCAATGTKAHHDSRLTSLLDRTDGRSDRRAGWRARRRDRVARRAHGHERASTPSSTAFRRRRIASP